MRPILLSACLTLFLCCHGSCSNGGLPLAKMPASQYSARIAPDQGGHWNVTLEIVPQDTSLCPTISNRVAANINGKPLGLSDSGGARRIKGGADTCGYPRFEAFGLSADPANTVASIRLSDDSATYVIESPAAFSQAQTSLTAPTDGVLHPGTSASVAVSTGGDAIHYARVGLSLDAAPTTSLFSADSTGGYNSISLNGMSFSFLVPATVSKAGPGRLTGSIDIAGKISVCTGPAQCNVNTGSGFTIPVTLANP
jgi:hypothetical protein